MLARNQPRSRTLDVEHLRLDYGVVVSIAFVEGYLVAGCYDAVDSATAVVVELGIVEMVGAEAVVQILVD